MIETVATVVSNRELSPGYRLLALDFKQDINVRPGQFSMLKPAGSIEPLLRRALAVYKVHGPRRLSFLYQVLGRGTEALSQARAGEEVAILLPLGNSWPIDDPVPGQAIVVAGGIGTASVLMLCERLRSAQIDSLVFFGAASKRVAAGCGLEDFQNIGLPLTLTTDDGSLGQRGFVTEPLQSYLNSGRAAGSTIYACGPWVMMRRVAELAAEFSVNCFVSLEAPMACGFGVCVGCVVAINSSVEMGYHSYKRVCTDGSIFRSDEIRWEIHAMTH
jgi:dihydroorotate dehydrogenase electron transfer subunit